MPETSAGTGTNTQRERHVGDDRERRPSLAPAIVSGGCAVMVALVTGMFNWINRPSVSPAAPTPTLTIDRSTRGATARGPMEIRTAAAVAEVPAPARPEPVYRLNFAAFQSVVRDTKLRPEVREAAIDRVVGNAVLWQGYVAEAVPNDPSEHGFVATVVLVEDPVLVTQTLRPHAAYCRFPDDPGGRVLQLKPGQRITVSGDCSGHSVLGTEIENCTLSDVHF